MISLKTTTVRLGAALLAIGFAGNAAGAQEIRHVYSGSQLRETPSVALSRHLRTLAESPKNSSALRGAGEAALAMGDPQTALTFFARAEEVSPRDGRVKAGMGSAFVLLEQPAAALRFFTEAAGMGIAERTFAGDRGLAYDLIGDPKHAQADYRMALQFKEDPEIRQRLALSLAISGDREGALETIEDLIRKQDRGAWRTRAFILALTGDTAGATQATQAVMPAQASAMQPFYARLPWLTPAQRAMAVHFGRFPEEAMQSAAAPSPTQYAGAASTTPPTAKPVQRAPATAARRQAPPPEPVSKAPRRRPDDRDGTVKLAPFSEARRDTRPAAASGASRKSGRTEVRTASRSTTEQKAEPSDPAPARALAARDTGPGFSAQLDAALGANAAPQSAKAEPVKTAAADPSPPPARRPEKAAPVKTAAADPAPAPARKRGKAEPVKTAVADPPPPPAREPPIVRLPFGPPTPGTPPRLADIREAVSAIPEPAAEADKAAPANAAPSRHWVQIAGGANKDALPRAFDRLKEQAPDLLSGKTAWTTPLRFTNRLLVGPFESESEAQAFVNDLAKVELSAFSWTSEEGQEIEKLAAN